MSRLVKYELRKIFSNRYILPVLLVFLVLAFYQDFLHLSGIEEAQREFYRQYGGVLTQKHYETIQQLANMKDNTDERGWFKQEYTLGIMALDHIQYMISFQKTNDSILERAQDNIAYFQEKDYPGLVRLNQRIVALYKDAPQPELIPSRTWRDFFTGFLGCTFLAFPLLFIVLLVSNIFSGERENNLYPVIKSSFSGLGETYTAKLIATGICSIGTMLLFVICNLLVKSHLNCLYGWNAPIRSIPNFAYSWLDLTIWQTVLLSSVCMCLGALFFGLFTAVIVSFILKNLFGMIAAFVFLIVEYLWAYTFEYYTFIYTRTVDISVAYDSITNLINSLRYILPTFLLEPFYYFENYRYAMVGTLPVSALAFNIGINVVVLSCLICVSYKAYTSSGVKRIQKREVLKYAAL